MVYKWVYGDGLLKLASGYAKGVHHFMLLEQIVDELGRNPKNYCGGAYSDDPLHGGQFDSCRITWQGQGTNPTADQIKYMIQQKLRPFQNREQGYVAQVAVDRLAADVEDTEPEFNFSFLKHPHDDLYPPAFEGGKKITSKAKEAIKNHVLNQLELNEYPNADKWIYFTIYGSGISYNWDEDGDFDVQMWVDVNKYNEANPDDTNTSDDLIAEMRRIIQMVNFPSFKEIGLTTDDEDGGEGRMLIQYYPKPGEGTPEENLSSKPYACYDLETDEWLQEPKPLTPEFYGEHFLSVMQKAEDIAVQAEALLEELQRNTVSWQFWSAMLKESDNSKYREALDMAERNALAEKEGVKVLFQGVFGGRAEAYSEGGEGIDDERDVVQKLLEVWGVFQRLKHFARQELPWEEQELPKESSVDVANFWKGSGSPLIPFTDRTRWYWNSSGLYVWNPPENEPEINHAQVMMSVPGGFDPRSAESGYVRSDGAIHMYSNGAADNREAVSQAFERWLGHPVQFVEDKENDEQTSIAREARWPWQKDDDHIPTVAEGEPFPAQPENLRLNDPVRSIPRPDPYAWWDFRADPTKQVPIGSLTRWLWTPGTGLHVWNPPDDEGEVYHDMYLHQLPQGRRDKIMFNTPSGYLLQGGGVFAYPNPAWDKWHDEVIKAIEDYQGQVNYVVDDFKNNPQTDSIFNRPNKQLYNNSSIQKFADWSEIMQNARELKNNGSVQITSNGSQHVEGTVASQEQPGVVYNTEFDRADPNSGAITTWNCSCPWGSVSWGRTRQWKKYEGRPCKHTLAMFWQSQSQPVNEAMPENQAQPQQQLFDPSSLITPNAPGGANTSVPSGQPPSAQPPSAQPPSAQPPSAPAMSQPVPMGQGGSVAIPGALSKIKKSNRKLQTLSAFRNGQVVTSKIPLWGIDRDQNQQMIPVGALGEVLWSDDTEAIVIFPTDNGILEPHLVRVQSDISNFRASRAKTPFVRKRD